MPRSRRDRTDPAIAQAVTSSGESVAAKYQREFEADLPPCPDKPPAGSWEMRGRLWEGSFNRDGRLVGSRTRSYPSRAAVEGQVKVIRESGLPGYGQMRKVRLREGEMDWWGYGLDNNPSPWGGGLTTPYIPMLPGPATRQLYWRDYFAMSAKAFEASNHNPLAKRATELHTEFVIGRGVECKAKTDTGQKCWDAFWRRNNMDERLEELTGDIYVYGELFLRFFPAKGNPRELDVRSLDPAGIYEIVSDQEDWESVYFYHQQEQERAQLFAPPGGDIAPQGPTDANAVTRYVVRQIPAEEVDHFRVNARSGEARGRSDLFSALGFLKRLQDLLTSKVVRTDMEARMVFDLMVKGNAGDVTAIREALFPGGKPPEPGTVVAHNENAELQGLAFDRTGAGEDTTVDEIVEMVANGVGVSRQYIWTAGKSSGAARAGALVATEPSQKRFERRQRLMQRILRRMADRVFGAAGLSGEDAEMEFIFPSIAVEERSAALKDIAFAESMGWISKKTGATMSARQLDIETFDFEDEQEAIAEEFEHTEDDEGDGDEGKPPTFDAEGNVTDPGEPATKPTPKQGDGVVRRPMVNSAYRQEPKLDPTKSAGPQEDQPPGLLVGAGIEGAPPPGMSTAAAPGRAGVPGNENPATQAGKAKIRQDSGGGAKLQEAWVPAETHERMVAMALREAALAGGRVPRRRPDDPEFREAAEAYRDGSRRNLRDLSAGHSHTGEIPEKIT